jgi:hypothetical protein
MIAMEIDSDSKGGGGASRGSISRNYAEDRTAFSRSFFGHCFRPALGGDGLPFQRIGGACAEFAHGGIRRRHYHAPSREV